MLIDEQSEGYTMLIDEQSGGYTMIIDVFNQKIVKPVEEVG